MMYFSFISNQKYMFSIVLMGMYHLILIEKGLFMWRASALYERGASSPLCVPLRALEWGYDCFALRAMSLRDGTRC